MDDAGPHVDGAFTDDAVPDMPECAEEVCNDKDDDCDGLVDEGFPDSDLDLLADCGDDDDDNDGAPDTADCEPLNPAVHPMAAETCNGIDDDCNGATDEGLCDDEDPCTDDVCTAVGCDHAFNVAPCDDHDVCTTGDTCDEGVCVGTGELTCTDDNPCTDDLCHEATGCSNPHNNAPCEDGSACTSGDLCQNGWCNPGAIVQCADDGNPCTIDECQPALGCAYTNNDGASCVTNAPKCPQGSCIDGICMPKLWITCTTEVGQLCPPVTLTGYCDAVGNCKVSTAPVEYTCNGCYGVCLFCGYYECVTFDLIF